MDQSPRTALWHKEIWTYLIVTLVAVLIWAWAASETRERKQIPSAKVQFVVTDPSNWLVSPGSASIALNVEGSKVSVQKLTSLLRQPISVTVPVKIGRQTIDLVQQLRQNEDIMAAGATIVSTDPERVDIELDQLERIPALVKHNLPGVTPEGEVTVQPREVTVTLPSSLRQRLPQDFAVEAFVDRTQLDAIQPGEPQSLEVALRLPSTIAGGSDVRMNPAKALVNFTIRSRIRETKVDSVRVQIAGPPEDREGFEIEVEPKVLRDVTVLANADLSRQIESGEAPVIAVLHLSSREKEAMIEQKAVSYFLAAISEADGVMRYEQLDTKPGSEMPVVNLTITRRATPPS
jgi:hypothetical protein